VKNTSLNMLTGIVVNVMNDEHQNLRKQRALAAHEPTLKDLYLKLEAVVTHLINATEKTR